ncbi:MAG: NAD-dependent epimerase/dehydratase family protein [Candidatus Thorarchaeota archaeon]
MRVLLTGASGFIGRKLASEFVKAGHEVTALVRPTSNTSGLPESIRFVEGDVLDIASLQPATESQAVVVHLATYFDFFPSDEELMYRVNTEGPQNMMRACVGTSVERFIYCSTTETIGAVKYPPGNEDTELRPAFRYAESKVAAEIAIREITSETDLPHIILRPTGVTGEGDLYAMYDIVRAVHEGIPALPRDMSGRFMWSHVDDVAAAFCAALGLQAALNSTIILCPDEPMTWAEFVDLVGSHLGSTPPGLRVPAVLTKVGMAVLSPIKNRKQSSFFWHLGNVDFMSEDRWYTNKKAKRMLGWTPSMTIEQALKRAMDWWLDNGYLTKE